VSLSSQQHVLFDRGSGKKSALAKRVDYERQNLEAANLILSDRKKWERECVFLIRWAERVERRAAECRPVNESDH
jgi:hypothetical protein